MATEFESRQVLDDGLTKTQLANSALYLVTTAIDNTDSPYLVTSTDEVVAVDTSTAAVLVTLPLVSSSQIGRKITIKDSGGNGATNTITISPNAADLIEGLGTPLYLESNFVSVTLLQTDVEWVRLDSFGTISQPEASGFVLESDIPGEPFSKQQVTGITQPDFEPAVTDTDDIPGAILSKQQVTGITQPDFEPAATDTDDIPGTRSLPAYPLYAEPFPQAANSGGTDDIPPRMTETPSLYSDLTPQVANDGGTDDIPVNMV